MGRRINRTNLLAAFAITSLIFFSGFYLNDVLTSSKLTELQEFQDFLNVESASIEAQYDLALQNPCNIAGITELNAELNEFGDKLTYLETISPDNDINVNNLYNYYTVLEVKHYLFMTEVNAKCSDDYSTILYFYSNEPQICESCSLQGTALTALKHLHPNTMVYSFSMDSDSKVVGTLKQLYDVTILPTVVVNGKKYEGYQTRKELENLVA